VNPNTTTTVLIPDDEDFWALVERGEEPLLLQLAIAEDAERYSDQSYQLPAPLADQVALDAYHRIQDALHDQRRHPHGRQLGPDGRYEHLPLLLITPPGEDLAVLDGALQALNRALAHQVPDLAELLGDIADSWRTTAAELVGDFGRVLAVLTLPADEHTRQLTERLAAAGPGADVVLTAADEAAYQHVVGRLNLLLTNANPIDRYKY
jgi:hypothetical protein